MSPSARGSPPPSSASTRPWPTGARFWTRRWPGGHPPASCVRSCCAREKFDLKRGGLAPIVALGRWAAIATADTSGSTIDRLDRAARAGLLTADERDTLCRGFEHIYTLVYDLEVRAIRAGTRFTTCVRPSELGSLDRRHLRDTLRAVGHVQLRVVQPYRSS